MVPAGRVGRRPAPVRLVQRARTRVARREPVLEGWREQVPEGRALFVLREQRRHVSVPDSARARSGAPPTVHRGKRAIAAWEGVVAARGIAERKP
jgi:hypothetical protein